MTTPATNPRAPRAKSLLYKVFTASLMMHIGLILLASPLVLYSHFFRREVSF